MRIVTAALTGLLFSLSIFAAEPAPTPSAAPALKTNYVEGKDYTLISEPVKPTDPSKIEVVEVFAYTCPHCMHFEPLISAWAKKLPADVSFLQTHLSWSPQMEAYQRGFYTLAALKMKDKLQSAVFSAIHVVKINLSSAQDWADLLALHGLDKQTVLKTYDSFGVTSQIKQADARARGYKVASTPAIIVEGKYSISAGAEGHEGMLKVAQFLIDKTRAERAHH